MLFLYDYFSDRLSWASPTAQPDILSLIGLRLELQNPSWAHPLTMFTYVTAVQQGNSQASGERGPFLSIYIFSTFISKTMLSSFAHFWVVLAGRKCLHASQVILTHEFVETPPLGRSSLWAPALKTIPDWASWLNEHHCNTLRSDQPNPKQITPLPPHSWVARHALPTLGCLQFLVIESIMTSVSQ